MKFKILLILTFSLKFAVAQNIAFKSNEILIQKASNSDIEKIVSTFNSRNEEKITAVKRVSGNLDIWKLNINAANPLDVISKLKTQNDVLIAQVNHILTLRKAPNDPSFSNQWQYINSGQFGGIIDADIDADLAWDWSTGGVTANGDTIVVAVIDDGLDINHPDLGNNIWVNHNEIPDNGMDDDNNGFIDDINGWNTYLNNNDITDNGQGSHGTRVWGVIGAKGNNEIGVAGVNWHVKGMIVVGGGDESEAIAAYDYVLTQKKMYLQSNGQQGAYVVATNSSWGTDFGQPADAPLWCAFYDSMGVYGILSAGATINGNQNVDLVGDLPTACPSNYLISVTNTASNDTKINFAGYGLTTIDLGAPGSMVYNISATNFGGAYSGNLNGTSFATPHVAGAIALLHSLPSKQFADLSISNPSQASSLIKEFILTGVDTVSSLKNITVTGGRLNLFGAMQKFKTHFNDLQFAGNNEKNLESLVLKLYPNPTNNWLKIVLNEVTKSPIELKIFSASGQLVKSEMLSPNAIYNINVSELSKGLYFVHLQSDDKTFSEKLLIQ